MARDRAVLLTKSCLPPEWIVRDEHQETDYGVDVEVELAADTVTGHIFKGQIKGHAEIPWARDSTYFESIRIETLNHWRALRLPVVLLTVDLRAEVVYWAPAKVPEDSGGVRVERARALPATSAALAEFVIHDGHSIEKPSSSSAQPDPAGSSSSATEVSGVSTEEFQKRVGVLWSHRADIAVHFEIVEFEAALLGRLRRESFEKVCFQELYRRDAGYLVYSESVHRGDWCHARLHGVDDGEPLDDEELLHRFPELASACGIHRVRRI